ncbi:MAG: hypothetical protein AAF447_16215 [Myxococcota bacterium]
MRRVLLALAILLSSCLPEAPELADAGPDPLGERDLPPLDAPPPFRLLGVRVEDPSGNAWTLEAAPRRPTLVLEASRSWSPEAPAWLLGDDLDEATLTEDLARAPARVATLATELPTQRELRGTQLRLTPSAPLPLGAAFRWAVPAWAEAEDGSRLGVPEVGSGRVAREGAGATLLATWPPEGAAGVPPGLTGAAFAFDDALEGFAGLGLRGPDGPLATEATPAPCAGLGWPEGTCVTLRWEGALAPGPHALTLSGTQRDWTGGALGPREARFAVSEGGAALALLPLTCTPGERPEAGTCVRADDASVVFRFTASGPVRAALVTERGTLSRAAPRGEATLEVSELPPATSLTGTLTLTGLDGSRLVRTLALATTPPLSTLALTEVCSDPLGREPRQEWVEVLNYGDVPVALEALTLADAPSAPGDVLPPLTLPAGGRALLVADAFVPEESPEAIPAGVPLVRLGTSLASGGLTNAGEPVLLRDAEGRRLAAAPARATGAGLCLRNEEPERRAGSWSVGACTPGAP